MLAEILKNMWVDPEVLEALSDEQKKILFLKMRQEQVRRWREREEKEGQNNNETRPKNVSSKRVTWLLGRDGDVSVNVIGEMDEFRSSKLLQNLMNNRLSGDKMNGIQTADSRPGREAQQLGFKGDVQLPLADEDHASPNQSSSEEDADSCGAEDDPKDPGEDSGSESGSGSDNPADWAPLRRPRLSNHGNQPPLKAPLSGTERDGPRDREIVCREEAKADSGGRVAQLRKTFNSNTKPPVPAKPADLHERRTPFIH
ncbi:uncharacterized protein zgc:92242 isoform X2 [Betta splendens]|uniref:Uncharacterized protein zgc:92242 isoform X2 n=1 Tax=Betta splendens TaxID=158456 RepID=A0A6P7NUT4_BETSP|nr:uncharacterized protein zgc:92242 isoform X2 [Betta splendens]